MATLKEIRCANGKKQTDLASLLKRSMTEISHYENDVLLPELEDMIILENKFEQRIDWLETVKKKDKLAIIEAINVLWENYPLAAVLSFAQRALKQGSKMDSPGILIKHFANVSKGMDPEPMYPDEVE